MKIAGLVAILAISSLASGCAIFDTSNRGTIACSCGGTGCNCKHCTGESARCRCKATDAYPDKSIGEPEGR